MLTNPSAKPILCFGDSLTWGYVPSSAHLRYPADTRWPGVLQSVLGDSYEVIEEGLNSRGIENGDSRTGKEGRRGLDYIEACLDTHDPLDAVIVLLGTNELKFENDQTPRQIAASMRKLLYIVLRRPSQFRLIKPSVILVSPPIVDETKEYTQRDNKYKNATKKSIELAKEYKILAHELGIAYVDTSDLISPGDDGVHIDEANHKKLGEKMAKVIKEVI